MVENVVPPTGLQIESTNDGVTIRFQRAGRLVCAVHAGISISVTLVGVRVWMSVASIGTAGPLVYTLPAAIVLVGIWLLVSSVDWYRTRTTLDAGPHGLRIRIVRPIRPVDWRWQRTELNDVKLRFSESILIDARRNPVMWRPAGRREDIVWLAWQIRRALGLAPQTARRPALPADSRLAVVRSTTSTWIVAPSQNQVFLATSVWFLVTCGLFAWIATHGSVPGTPFEPLILSPAVAAACCYALARHRARMPTTFVVRRSGLALKRPLLCWFVLRRWRRSQVLDATCNHKGVVLLLRRRLGPLQMHLAVSDADNRWISDLIRHEMDLLDPTDSTERAIR